MSTAARIPGDMTTQRYEAVLRVSEALTACSGPKELARNLADALGKFLHFNQLFLLVVKENSKEIESAVLADGQLTLPDLAVEDLPSWQAFDRQDLLYVADWSTEQRFPRFKEWASKVGRKLGSTVSVPLTTPHRRLGAFGITRETTGAYSEEDIVFLRLIGRVVAFALDDGFNLRRAHDAQKCLQYQKDRLQLLLNLSKRITSSLELRELLRAVAANVREAMQCDAVAVTLLDPSSGKYSLYALDFPQGKGFLKEQEVLTLSGASRRVVETLQPEIIARPSRADVAPEMYEKVMAEGLKSTCLIPLANRGRVLGVLAISRVTDTTFTSDDLDFLTQAAGQVTIAIENALTFKEVSELRDKLAQEKLYLEEEIRSDMGFEQIIGSSAALKHVLELVNTVAPSDSTVLLLGETGTGKELIARAIHEHSRRKDRTFVKLNCAAIPTGLLESELFGHEKGAFTGAISQKVGRLELADHGTLFLDEVGDIPIEIQPKLLRALQEGEFERLGSTHTRKVNVRLIAATNRDLEKMVASREFRSDLYYRLHVFPIRIPPLRDRREDIPQLVSYFVQKFAKQMQRKIESISPAVMKGLTAWEWPGNIRELENFIERAVIVSRGKSLEAPLGELRKPTYEAVVEPGSTQSSQQNIAEIVKQTLNAMNAKKTVTNDFARKQQEEIVRALTESKGRVGGEDGAAARMGTKRSTLLSRMKRFGIDPKQYA